MRHGHHGRIMIMSKPRTFYLILTSSIGFQTNGLRINGSHKNNGALLSLSANVFEPWKRFPRV